MLVICMHGGLQWYLTNVALLHMHASLCCKHNRSGLLAIVNYPGTICKLDGNLTGTWSKHNVLLLIPATNYWEQTQFGQLSLITHSGV